jgi:hypothetical protein
MSRYVDENRTGEWIGTYTGNKFWLTDPRVEDIHIEDIAHALAKNCRYTGHTLIMYSVAQHCLLATMEAINDNHSTLIQLYVLLHDASETWLNDMSRPLKATKQMEAYLELEELVQSVVWDAFDLPQPTEEDWKIVKHYDDMLLANEIGQIVRCPSDFGIEPMYNIPIAERHYREVAESFIWALETLLRTYKSEKEGQLL